MLMGAFYGSTTWKEKLMLSHTKIENAKPKAKPYKIADYGGLYIKVMPNGSKLWGLKYYYLQKEKKLSMGPYPAVSLLEAREMRDKAKKALVHGQDPSLLKQEEKRRKLQSAANSFESVAREWFEHASEIWTENTRRTKLRRLEMYVFPVIGHMPITEIKPMTVLDCIRRVEAQKAYDVARRLKQIISRIFKYAVLHGKVDGDPTPFLDGALTRSALLVKLKTKPSPPIQTNTASTYPQANSGRTYASTRPISAQNSMPPSTRLRMPTCVLKTCFRMWTSTANNDSRMRCWKNCFGISRNIVYAAPMSMATCWVRPTNT
ncbi:MAG: DUF4102 domain-containing protein [Alphaproteobacteria bacterium PRO2]|nr:DUF4102 domain-containing protein [Alphaproteobacteria bacterium PRO2]